MAVGKISTHVLTDIANAIRRKGGTAAALTPREMPGAIAALDGTDAGAYEERGYVEPEYGVLPASALSAIADAIRAKGGYSATFKPDEMPAAICALEFDVGMRRGRSCLRTARSSSPAATAPTARWGLSRRSSTWMPPDMRRPSSAPGMDASGR